MSTPAISIVMPVYNAAATIDEAVRSILDQTWENFEFIIVDDGSSDETPFKLERYEKLDSRVRLYPQQKEGMIAALNRGCRVARGHFIARMDADDVSLPHRLQKQIRFLETHPGIGILGTWAKRIDDKGSTIGEWCLPANPRVLRWNHFFGVSVIHPTVVIRREILERINFYRWDAIHAEDRDLWLRASAITEFSNLPEILFKYRVWRNGTSRRLREQYGETQIRLLASFVREFLKSDVSIEAVAGLQGVKLDSLERIRRTATLVEDLYRAFICTNPHTAQDRKEISWDAAKRMGNLALRASQYSYREFMLIFRRALRLNSRLVSPSAILKGLERYRLVHYAR